MENKTTTRKTQRMMFTEILENPSLTQEQRDFLTGRINALDKKNATTGERKPTPAQVENRATMDAILAFMVPGIEYTVADLRKSCPACADLSPQKVGPMMRTMADNGEVMKNEYKPKHFKYSIPTDEEEDEG